MSQAPRWYRKQWYERELGLHSPNAGLYDQADVAAMRAAVEAKLDEDDRKFARRQHERTQQYLKQLSRPPQLGSK